MPTYICSGEYAAADWEGTLADPAGWTEVVPDLAKRAVEKSADEVFPLRRMSKDELVEEVVCTGIADVREHVSTAVAQASAETTPMDRIMIAVDVHLRHTLAISDYTTAAIRNAGHVPERVRKC